MIGRILPVVLLVLALLIFVAYINPTYTKEILPLQAQIKQYDSTLAAAADFNKKEAELAAARSAIPADSIARLQAYLPDGVDNVQLILDLNALAAKSGIALSNFNITSTNGSAPAPDQSTGSLPLEAGGQPTDSIDLTVSGTGTYNAFRTFLDGVEQSLRPMDMVQMTLTDSTNGIYTYNFTFRIYWLH
jgi:Tfp pilus assembly protein PilO